jgi:hypothetical protein
VRGVVQVKFMIQLEDRILTGERPPIPEDCVPAYRQLIEDCWNVRSPPAEAVAAVAVAIECEVVFAHS